MKDVRLGLTENEKIAQQFVGLNNDHVNFNMAEGNIKDIISREKQNKFNDMVDAYVDKLAEHTAELRESTEKLGYDITKLEIKPTFNRILLTLFDKNPFQKITTTKSGIITDMGGMAPSYKNTDSGEIEEAKQMIIVGVIQEVGPDVKYAKVGDTIFLDRDSARPVPFYKQGFHCISEQQIIAIVNEGLEDRFESIKENGRN